jgi:hypothetical protein
MRNRVESSLLQRIGLVLLCGLLSPRASLSLPASANAEALTPRTRAQLAQAADDARLAGWQREFMRRLARGSDAPAGDSHPSPSGTSTGMQLQASTDGMWGELVLAPREQHSAIYDPVRDRMVVFSGDSYRNDVWALYLAGTPAWIELTPTGTPPGPRLGYSAIYDPVRDRMIVFGGMDYRNFAVANDVWALTFAGTPAWVQLTPTGLPPNARQSQSAIYDPVRDRMVVFGGFDGQAQPAVLGDVWALTLAGTPAWSQIAVPWVPREGHSAIYDPVRDRMVVFGGYDGFGKNSLILTLTLANSPAWAQVFPSGPAPGGRDGHSAIYDPVHDRMELFGGRGELGEELGDAWTLSLAGSPSWAQRIPSGNLPSARVYHSAVYDPVRGRMLVFAGEDTLGSVLGYSVVDSDTWALSLSGSQAWTQIAPTRDSPDRRMGHSSIYDGARNRMITYGGSNMLGDTWALALIGSTGWTRLTPTGTPPSARSAQSAIYDPVRDRMVVFGGLGASRLNDVWALSLVGTPAWTQLTPTGAPPSARSAHSAIYDPVRDRMIVFGGLDGAALNDVWALALGNVPSWTQLTPSGAPPSGRSGHSAIYDSGRDRMVVFGGTGSSGLLSDTWSLSLAGTPSWTQLAPSGAPPSARANQTAIYDPLRSRMVVFGGRDAIFEQNDAWSLSMAGSPTWMQLAPAGLLPIPRARHSAIYDSGQDRMVIFGGGADIELWHDVWALRWNTAVGVDSFAAAPEISCLYPPAPNPSRGSTSLRYSIPRAGRIRLGIYDVGGRQIRGLLDREQPAGVAEAVWDGSDDHGARVSQGVYFVRLASRSGTTSRKLVLAR